jgi:CO/xanthine dehydrogenase Mo-binding subunit
MRGYSYYTNNPPGGAFRGFGVCQTQFALENCINLLAEKVGISPWEIRYRNAIEPGKVLPNGQIADCSTALKESLLAVKDVYEANESHAGIACAMKNAGVGVGIPDKGRARMRVRNGVVETFCAASDIGQGCKTIFAQMAVESTGLPLEKIKMMPVSTELGPDSGTTSGSRQTTVSGEAIRMVGLDVKKALDEVGGDLSKLEGQEWYEEFFDPTDKLGADVPFPKSHVCYGFATSVVILDEDDLTVKEIWQAHDSGRVVNPIAIQGQIEGGVLMSMGYGLQEKFTLEDCVPKVKYGTIGLFRADKIPDIHAIYVEKDEQNPFSYGAKGVGEITSIPCAQAIAGAYYRIDGKLRNKLPMEDTPYNKKKKVKK